MLPIIYRDNYLVAINKPHGLLVHQSPIARNADEFAVQLLRDQIGMHVTPAHRLDRKTGGVLLFTLKKEVNSLMQMQFQEQKVKKTYHAIVRGYTPESGTIDYALRRDDGKLQDAITHYKTLAHGEIDVPLGKFQTSRYSLVEAKPETGRMHQLRKHFAHIHHPIIADRAHGCNKQNRMFKQKWTMDTMLLHATTLDFSHPITKEQICIKAGFQDEFTRMLNFLNLKDEIVSTL
ncbi:MAG: pseudouridine synthase [Cyclobacteriaceae bacterium]